QRCHLRLIEGSQLTSTAGDEERGGLVGHEPVQMLPERYKVDFTVTREGRHRERQRSACEQLLATHSSPTSTITSTSTAAPPGSWATPNAVLACRPRSPNASSSSSEAALMTSACPVKSAVLLT